MRFSKALRSKGEKLKKELDCKGFIYFIRHGELVKVGKTTNISNRMSQILNANPFATLCQTIELYGYGVAESNIHTLFSKNKVFREWFRLTDSDILSVADHFPTWGLTIIDIKTFPSTDHQPSDLENIKILSGENESLKKENQLLREIIEELQKSISFD